MDKTGKVRFAGFALALLCAGALFAYDPPRGGETVPLFYDPAVMGGGSAYLDPGTPGAAALNPALAAARQRVTLALDYAAIFDTTGVIPGVGSALNLGLVLPENYGVWSLGMNLLSMPPSFATGNAFPLGTLFTLRGSFSKDVYPDLWVGAGITGTLGSALTQDWGLALDLGFVRLEGDLDFLKDFRWGAAVTGMGKWFEQPGIPGAAGTTASTAYPSPFTLSLGASAFLVNDPGFSLAFGLGLSFPTFQNIVASPSLEMGIGGFMGLRAGWNLNLHEILAGREASYIPAFSLYGKIPLDFGSAADSFIAKSGWNRSDLILGSSALPLYDGIWGFSLSATVPLGSADTSPPRIEAGYSPDAPASVSPNSDGKADELVVPVKITDDRYVVGWTFTIKDDKGNVVRTILNKEPRPDSSASFFEALGYAKKGIAVPAEMKWNGLADSGERAPDGTYSFAIEAVDDNGNKGSAGPFVFYLDSTAPSATLAAKDPSLTFSPDGDGSKDAFTFLLSGSAEDLWVLQVKDAAGKVVRTANFKAASPADWTWDGKDDGGVAAFDGVYSATLSATDRAQNSLSVALDNIILSTAKPTVAVTIDSAAFSPNGDGRKDALGIAIALSSASGVQSWKLEIAAEEGGVLLTKSGDLGGAPPAKLSLDGKDAKGAPMPEGKYVARLTVAYVNGYTAFDESPAFVLDITPPSATVKADRSAFNPAAGGAVEFLQSGSAESAWKADVIGADGKVVRSFSFMGAPPAKAEWDGSDESGKILPDGDYRYRLYADDAAGNSFSAVPVPVAIDTEKKAVILSLDQRAFSPNGDGVKDIIKVTPKVDGNDKVESWELSMAGASGAAARSWKGKGAVPASFTWDGSTDSGGKALDGAYSAAVTVKYRNGDVQRAKSIDFALDTVAPGIAIYASPMVFNPAGGKRPATTIAQQATPGDSWTARMLDSAGKPVREWKWDGDAPDLKWDGTDEAGNLLKDGKYKYVISSADPAGNRVEKAIDGITIDTKEAKAFLTASSAGFSPNGDGKFDDVRFGMIATLREGVETWKLAIVDASGAERKAVSGSGKDPIPAQFIWDGKGDDGLVQQGTYTAVLSILYVRGDEARATAGPIALDSEAPKLSISFSPEYFSPDNDGVDDELSIDMGVSDASAITGWKLDILEISTDTGAQRLFTSFSGTGAPAPRIAWDGKNAKGETVDSATDYRVILTVFDLWANAGQTDKTFTTDVLVIKDGEVYKIKLPTIVFMPMKVDFSGLAPEKAARNMATLKRVVEILNRFRDYKIVIEGHAVNGAKLEGARQSAIDKEERDLTLPFSIKRAESMRQMLIKLGLAPARVTVVGRGSSMPYIDLKDVENRWKNRRVEFILMKK